MKARDVVTCLNNLEILKMQIKTKMDKLESLGLFHENNFNEDLMLRCKALKMNLEYTLLEIERVYRGLENE